MATQGDKDMASSISDLGTFWLIIGNRCLAFNDD